MAPQGHIPAAADVLDYWNCCWCVQLLPQIWTNWRTKSTEGLPGTMLILWALCGVPFGAYSVVQNFNIPIQVQPQAFMALCTICWVQTLIYHNKWRVWKAGLLAAALLCAFGGVETALILTIKPIYQRGNETPVLVIGIVASVLLVVGLIPPYLELWKRRGRVVGINFLFLGVDWCGAFFSLMALAAQNSFDVEAGVMYILCCLIEGGIFVSHLVWLARTYRIRREARANGKTFDDVAAEHEERGAPFKFAERKGRGGRGRKEDEEQPAARTADASEIGGEHRGEPAVALGRPGHSAKAVEEGLA